MSEVCDLSAGHCVPCEGGVPRLDAAQVQQRLAALPGWTLEGTAIEKTYRFANHHETMAFVNAVAFVSHREDHHPQMTVGYADCCVRYWTHAIGGLSDNDFICAAKVDRLLAR